MPWDKPGVSARALRCLHGSRVRALLLRPHWIRERAAAQEVVCPALGVTQAANSRVVIRTLTQQPFRWATARLAKPLLYKTGLGKSLLRVVG